MRRSGRVAEPGAERTHQRGGVQILRGGQDPGDAAVGPDQLRVDIDTVRAGGDGVDPSGPRARGVADLRAAGEANLPSPTVVPEPLARKGHTQAHETLRRYIRDGIRWIDAPATLAYRWPAEWWDDLWETAATRIRPDDVAEVLPAAEPWPRWRGRDPRIDTVLNAAQPAPSTTERTQASQSIHAGGVRRQAQASWQGRQRKPQISMLEAAEIASVASQFLRSSLERDQLAAASRSCCVVRLHRVDEGQAGPPG